MEKPVLLLQYLGVALSFGALASALQLHVVARDDISLGIGSCELEQAWEISREQNDRAFLIIGDVSFSWTNQTCCSSDQRGTQSCT